MINANIILDSINPCGNRLTTYVLTFPRWILAELNTHRMFSRNTASSRAIPIEKMIDMAKTNPAMPIYFGKNARGMQATEELVGKELQQAKDAWLRARDRAIESAEELMAVGMHKQHVNRVIENFLHVKTILTGTEFENFFALRAHKDAQPEFQELAYLMLKLYQDREPVELKDGQWHVPFGDQIDTGKVIDTPAFKQMVHPAAMSPELDETLNEAIRMIATARCARVSYLNFEGKDDYNADILLAQRLATSGHWSPFEHCATPQFSGTIPYRSGNFVGWQQYRKMFSQENRRDGRVGGAKHKGGAVEY